MTKEQLKELIFDLNFRHAAQAVWITSMDGEIIEANHAAEVMVGYSLNELRKKKSWELYADPSQREGLLEKLRESGQIKEFEVALKKKDDTPFRCLVSCRLVPGGEGDQEMIYCALIQNSREREFENLLNKERSFISAILETTGALVIVLDAEGRFIRINDIFEKTSGYGIIELLGKPVWEMILPAGETIEFRNTLKKMRMNGGHLEHKGNIVDREGRSHAIVWTITSLKDEEGTIEFFICTGIDITDLQEALLKIKTLSGLLPICSFCKKIRDDRGYWNMLEEYLRDHSDAHFSHSLCPDCMRKQVDEIKKKHDTGEMGKKPDTSFLGKIFRKKGI